jgi:uncharacterized membrane protein HdeD (DUF308 family)
MSQTETTKEDKLLTEIPYIVGVFRGLFAILLGIALWINPDKSRTMLGNFMGFFWLSSGFLLLFKQSEEAKQIMGKRTYRIVGVVAIITGLLVVTRRFSEMWVGRGLLVQILAVVIMLTGVVHIMGEVRIGLQNMKGLALANFILGLFEVVLGAMLLISPLSFGPVTYLIATIWAVVGGVTIVGTAVYDRIKAREHKKNSSQKA